MKAFRLNDCEVYCADSLDQAITLAMEETGLSRIEVLCDGSEGEIPESELRQIKVTDRDKPGSPVIGTAWDFLRKQKTPGYLFGSEY